MRIAAALIVLILSLLMGVRKSFKLKYRAEFLEEILLMLNNFSAEIRFRGLTAEELISAEKGKFAELVKSRLSDCNIKTAWEEACLELPQNQEESGLLRELGRSLGNSDKAGQLDIIALYSEKISLLQKQAAENYSGQGKAYMKIGLLCGIGLAVLII